MSKNTNWKNLGRKQGANMKNFRNMKADKMMYNDGKWTTVYSDDDIKRLAYYNIDLPHVVGIGTNTPFSRLSFGDSSNCGDHVSGILNPGKLASLALHEKTIQEEGLGVKKGQEFNGLGYVTKLRSVRSNINNKDANGVGIFSNKFISATDSSQKTDKAIMYITDDKHVQIGGVPTGYNLIDRRNGSSFISTTQETGPNIILDVSGSIHINGFINFLKNGADSTIKQKNDNPANQLTLNTGVEPSRIELCDSVDQAKTDNRAVPEGAIFVGFDKDANSDFLVTIPRLYIMVNGIQKRIATEDDKSFYEDNNSGFTFTGNNALDGGKRTYVFRNPGDQPGNTLINTFSGIMGDDFDGVGVGGRNLPQTYNGVEFSSETSALQVLGNISVFDSKYGGTDLSPLNTGNLEKARLILVTEIYDTTSSTGRELGTIYTDRHIMIGGQKYSSGNKPNLTFDYFGSAIDISGGITGKPAIRLISGGNKGSIKVSNPTDSIIIGNTPSVNFKTMNKECILVGENTKYENNVNTLVMGKDNNVTRTKNSLIVGNNLDVSFNNVTEGVVALGVGGTFTIGGNERIVFATNDGNTSKKALIIDKEGRVTISGDLNVEGDHVHLEVQRVVAKDAEIELNAKDDGTGNNNSEGASTLSGVDNGLSLFTTLDNTDTVKFSYDADNSRWTTAKSTSQVGLAVGGNPGSEKFVVDSTTGNVDMSGNLKVHGNTDISGKLDMGGNLNINDKFIVTASSGDVDMSGNLKVLGDTDISENLNINDKFKVTASSGDVDISGNVDISGHLLVKGGTTSNVFSIPNGVNQDITIAPNGTGKLIINSSLTANNFQEVIQINGGYNSGGAQFDISKNTAGDETTNLSISGKLTVDGLIDPTGLVLDNQTSFPNGGSNSNKVTIWSDSGTLKFTSSGSETESEFATKASVDAITSGGSGGTNVNSSNKVKVSSKDNNQSYKVLFAAAASGNNQQIFGDDNSFTFNPNLNTLTADKFDGKATKLDLNNAGFVKVDAAGSISVDTATYNNFTYTLPTAASGTLGGIKVGNNLSIGANGVLSSTDTDTTYSVGDGGLTEKNFTTALKGKLDGIATSANNYSLPTAASGTLGGVKVGNNLSIGANGVLSSTDTDTTYTGGTNISLSGTTFHLNDNISFNNGSNHTIDIAQSTSLGNDLTLTAGKGADGATGGDGAAGGKITISGGAGGAGGTGTGQGAVNGSQGALGDVDITGTNVNITGTLKANTIKSKDTNSNLILDTDTGQKIQFNKELISNQGTDLRLTTNLGSTTGQAANSIVLTAGNNSNGNNGSNGGSIKLNPGTAASNGAGVDGVIELNGTVTTASPNNLVLQAAPGKDVNITGNAINLTGTLNATTITASNNLTVSATTTSTSKTTGALTVAGGVGIAENAFIGGTLNVTGTLTAGTIVATQVNVPMNITQSLSTSPSSGNFYIGDSWPNNTADVTINLPAIGAIGDTIKYIWRSVANINKNVIFECDGSTEFDHNKSYIRQRLTESGASGSLGTDWVNRFASNNDNKITFGSSAAGFRGEITFTASSSGTSGKWAAVGELFTGESSPTTLVEIFGT